MLGLIPKLLFDMVKEIAGEDTLENIRKKSDLESGATFKIHENCPDSQWQKTFKATLEVLNLSQEQAEEAFADYFIKDAIKRWPMWFSMAKDSRDFLMRQPSIHQQLVINTHDKEYVEISNKKFDIEMTDNELVCIYNSVNHHCYLYKALAHKIVDHYNEKAEINIEQCKNDGHPHCQIRIRWLNHDKE